MKKILFILALGVLVAVGCNATTKENKAETNSETIATDGGGTEKLTQEKFLASIWNYKDSPDEWKYLGKKPALIDFYADWCGPCRIAAPILEEVSNEYAGKINVYKIDTQRERELASVFGIKGIPAFLYIPTEGKPVMMSGIGRSKEETKEMFKANIEKYLLKK